MDSVGSKGKVSGQSEHEGSEVARSNQHDPEPDQHDSEEDEHDSEIDTETNVKEVDKKACTTSALKKQKGEETDQMTRRSSRVSKPTWKVWENLESEAIKKFWKTINIANNLIRTLDETVTIDTSPFVRQRLVDNARHLAEDLDLAYREVRTTCEMVPTDVRQTADKYMQKLDRMLYRLNPDDTDKHSSVSRRSGSSRTSTSSKKALLTAQSASLRAEIQAKKIEGKKRLELTRLEAEEKTRQAQFEAEEKTRRAKYEAQMEVRKQELRDQEMMTQLQKTEAELHALEEQDIILPEIVTHNKKYLLPDDFTPETLKGNNCQNEQKTVIHQNEPKSDADDSLPDSMNIQGLLKAFTESMNRSRLPAPEPTIFSGDPLQYPAWKASFSALIESRTMPPNEKMHYLRRYLSGEAKESIEGVFYFDTRDAYDSAWKMLETRFGDPFLVSEAFRDKLEGWTVIGRSANKELRRLSDFLRQCLLAMEHIPELKVLNDCRQNKKILEKLPQWVTREWSKKVADHASYPDFKEFVKFMTKVSDRVCNPITSEATNAEYRSDRLVAKRPTNQAKTLEASTNELSTTWTSEKERRQHFMKRGLCFECGVHGHIIKDCPKRNRSSSKVETNYTSRTVTSLQTATDEAGCKCSMIVPVYISSCDNPNAEYLIYALLDTQSDTTFVLDEICDMINTRFESTRLEISTLNSTSMTDSKKFRNLQIRGMYSTEVIPLPTTYSTSLLPSNRQHIPTAEIASRWPHLENLEIPPMLDCRVGLLIGYDCPRAFAPINVVRGTGDEPFALKTELGWSIVGLTHKRDGEEANETKIVHRTRTRENMFPQILKILESDFQDRKSDKIMSQDDLHFMEILGQGIHRNDDGFYEMPLPFKQGRPDLPNNKRMASKRLEQLRKKLKADPQYREDYERFVNQMILLGDAELVPIDQVNKDTADVWYIPHHGVYHKKKGKLRVVFDCSARHHGTALNDHLLSGPNLMNSLIGCLIRFREKPIAVAGDIERMFYRFKVHTQDRDYLRFLWWDSDDLDSEPKVYRMTVHLFGAASSPGCANYALKRLAADNRNEFQPNVCRFISDEFYVDDGLVSCATVEEAIKLVNDSRQLCSRGNVRLHKFISNNIEVMQAIPESERAVEIGPVNLHEDVSIGRVLGIEWDVQSDHFQFRLMLDKAPMTRRGMLSTVASIYDPLGCLAPFVLLGKQILQEMCRERTGWDDPLSDELRPRWERWLIELPELVKIKIPRCYLPADHSNIVRTELHHFSDASLTGYGQCTYLRVMNDQKKVSCCLVMAKSRVSPLKSVTIPRMELAAAVVSTKISNILREEMTYQVQKEYFWTDSMIVLAYLKNDERRFHVYVANRIAQIKSSSEVDQWHYVNSRDNPADHASRGLYPQDLIDSNWFIGPEFLWNQLLPDDRPVDVEISPVDPEVKKIIINTIEKRSEKTILNRLEQFSRWQQVVTAIAVLTRFLQKRKGRIQEVDRRQAEMTVIRIMQAESFAEEPRKHNLQNLDPFLDDNGLLRVGGRLQRSSLCYGAQHPIILPKSSHLVDLIIRFCHEKVAHQGRGFTINEVRSRGYWIVGCSRAVSKLIYKCVTCRRLRGQLQDQKMAELPKDRLEMSPPFSCCGIDCFGPFVVKEGRREIKRYGLIITCMSSRAVHIETLDDMTTDCFIRALRCLIALRGSVQQLRCDQGSNFIGAKRILEEASHEVQNNELRRFLTDNQCEFVFNTPHSSHMGGSWERHIRTIRSILTVLLDQHSTKLDTSTLRTFLYEAMVIINSRPLTVQNLNDPLGPEPLTPNHLIMMKSKLPLPPPGHFVKEDVYARHRWRKVQYLAEEFWQRWKREYMMTLQKRNKWNKKQRNITVGDIVILKDNDLYRGDWKLAKVVETKVDDDGLVRRVKLLTADPNLSKHGQRLSKPTFLERPIHKLILLLENELSN